MVGHPLRFGRCWLASFWLQVRPLCFMSAIAALLLASHSAGEVGPVSPKPLDNPTEGAGNTDGHVGWLGSREFWLSVGILLFGLVVVFLMYLLLEKHASDRQAPRIFVIVLIVIGTMLIMTAGFTQAQLGVATALFGTVAGYLLSDLRHQGGGRTGGDGDG